jgi:hypothetical protein
MVTTPASYYPSNKYINETQHDEFASYYNRGFTNLNFILDGIIRLVGQCSADGEYRPGIQRNR